MAKTIPLTKGFEAIVDDDDYLVWGYHKWCATVRAHTTYAIRQVYQGKMVYLHTAIANPPPGMVVDHINGNGLDNRRANLRVCTVKENGRSKRTPRVGKTSPYRGVCYTGGPNPWAAHIKVDGSTISLGGYRSERVAAVAYDVAARKHFGDFAVLNFGGKCES